MPEFAGERGRWDGQDRALGMGKAAAAHSSALISSLGDRAV
jgi:hypothetical protein